MKKCENYKDAKDMFDWAEREYKTKVDEMNERLDRQVDMMLAGLDADAEKRKSLKEYLELAVSMGSNLGYMERVKDDYKEQMKDFERDV